MSFITVVKQTVLSVLLATCGTQAVTQTYTPENTAMFIQAYNVLYVNSNGRIASKIKDFVASNRLLSLKLLCSPSFIYAVVTKLRQGSRLSEYYEIFDIFDESGHIKAFAQKMLTEGKNTITDGVKSTQALIDAGYKVIILTGQDEVQNEEFKKAFPIMAHPSVEIVNSYNTSVASYKALKNACGKEHAILLYGNRNHTSVDNANEAGLIIKHYSQAIEA